jgi:hypothetical protein
VCYDVQYFVQYYNYVLCDIHYTLLHCELYETVNFHTIHHDKVLNKMMNCELYDGPDAVILCNIGLRLDLKNFELEISLQAEISRSY